MQRSFRADKEPAHRCAAALSCRAWAGPPRRGPPPAARTMTAQLEEMKAITLLPGTVTVRAALKDADRTALAALADALAQ